jgi:hypothetical protein
MDQILNNDKNILEDKKISIAIMSSFAILTIQYLILIAFELINTTVGNNIQLISKVIVGILYFMALPTVWKRNKIKFIGVYFISIFIFLLNYLLFQENWVHLTGIIFPFFFTCLPSFVYSYSINDWSVLKNVMKKTSLIVFTVGFIITILVFTGRASVGAYSMSLSYYMLLPAVFFFDDFLDGFQIKSIAVSLASILIILSLGARGPLMCIGVFLILKLFNIRNKLTFRNILIYVVIVAIILVGLFIFDTLLDNLNNLFLQFGIRSRTISLLLKDNLHLSGRDSLYKEMMQSIGDNPIFGTGLAGDRRVIGTYSHNIVIEVLSGFGIIIGGILILLLAIICYKSLFSKNVLTMNLICIWFSIGTVSLMVSGSYLTDFKFWIFLGLAAKLLVASKIRTNKHFRKNI